MGGYLRLHFFAVKGLAVRFIYLLLAYKLIEKRLYILLLDPGDSRKKANLMKNKLPFLRRHFVKLSRLYMYEE